MGAVIDALKPLQHRHAELARRYADGAKTLQNRHLARLAEAHKEMAAELSVIIAMYTPRKER